MQMELSGFNAETNERLNIWIVKPFTDEVVLKIRKNICQNGIFKSSSSYYHKILRLFDSNTILATFMTTQIITAFFFLAKGFFGMVFTSDTFIHGGECYTPWHYEGKHSLLNVAIC
jgi:hypothetical protein